MKNVKVNLYIENQILINKLKINDNVVMTSSVEIKGTLVIYSMINSFIDNLVNRLNKRLNCQFVDLQIIDFCIDSNKNGGRRYPNNLETTLVEL